MQQCCIYALAFAVGKEPRSAGIERLRRHSKPVTDLSPLAGAGVMTLEKGRFWGASGSRIADKLVGHRGGLLLGSPHGVCHSVVTHATRSRTELDSAGV